MTADKKEISLNTAMNKEFFLEIEQFLFNYVVENKGVRIHSTTRVQKKDPVSKEGETEWFYCNEDLIHDAFIAAKAKYKEGILYHFYLTGIDTVTGKTVQSINDLAISKLKNFPNFTGEIISKVS
jgi:hypothetical protein